MIMKIRKFLGLDDKVADEPKQEGITRRLVDLSVAELYSLARDGKVTWTECHMILRMKYPEATREMDGF